MQNVPPGRKSGFGGTPSVREADILLFYSPGLPDQGTEARDPMPDLFLTLSFLKERVASPSEPGEVSSA